MPLPLDELSEQLRDLGYSRRYIKRLQAELHDHIACAEELGNGQPNESAITETLGSPTQITAAVQDFPELTPLVRRFPLSTFVLFPSITLCLGTIAFVELLGLFTSLPANSIFDAWKPSVPMVASLSNIAFSLGIVLFACWLCQKYRLQVIYPIMSTIVMSVGSMLRTDVVYCRVSQSVSCFHCWNFDMTKFACLITALVCFLAFVLTQRTQNVWSFVTGSR